MIISDNYTNENNREHNSMWPYIPDQPYRILIIGGSGSGKTNALLNLIRLTKVNFSFIVISCTRSSMWHAVII